MGNATGLTECLTRDCRAKNVVEISPEEAYMLKRQQDLRLYLFSAADLEVAFTEPIQKADLSERTLVTILVRHNLIRQDYPKNTVFWNNFYAKLRVQSGCQPEPFYDVRSTMIAMYFLSHSKPMTKAKHINDLIFRFKTADCTQTRDEEEEEAEDEDVPNRLLSDNILRRKIELQQIFSIFTSISLNLLPFLASDFPESNKK